MTRRFTSEIINEIGPEKDIPAPDVGTNAATMAWIFDTYSMNKGHSVLGVVTGKPLTIGGSLGREEATARGGVFCLQSALEKQGRAMDGLSVAVQGFGNVGSFFAKFVGGARCEGRGDLRLDRRRAQPERPRRRRGVRAQALRGLALRVEGRRPHHQRGAHHDRLRRLAPCALEQVVTEANAADVKAKVIVEGANGPLTPAADDILESNGVLILPDVLANAGGVVVSYFEWVQGLQEYFWKEDEVNAPPERDRPPRVRRDLGDVRRTARSRCAWPPTVSPSSASPKQR